LAITMAKLLDAIRYRGAFLICWGYPDEHMGEIRAICDPYHWTIRGAEGA
jgi:hypothetical protein